MQSRTTCASRLKLCASRTGVRPVPPWNGHAVGSVLANTANCAADWTRPAETRTWSDDSPQSEWIASTESRRGSLTGRSRTRRPSGLGVLEMDQLPQVAADRIAG